MFFIILGTYTRWTFIIFSLAQRILLLIFQCHTVTHGTDLRRSPLVVIAFGAQFATLPSSPYSTRKTCQEVKENLCAREESFFLESD